MKGKGLSKLESIRTKARWSLPHLFQERKNNGYRKIKNRISKLDPDGSIKAQRHSRSHTNFDTGKKTTMKMDSKLEPKLERGSRYHTNVELKTTTKKTRTF